MRGGCIGSSEGAALPCLRLEHEWLLAILWAVPVIRHGTALLAAPSSWACSGRCDALGNPVWEGWTPCHLLVIYTPRLAFSACLAPLFLKGNVNIQNMFFETVVSPLIWMQPREFSALALTKTSKTYCHVKVATRQHPYHWDWGEVKLGIKMTTIATEVPGRTERGE